jgi:hypothetical protein
MATTDHEQTSSAAHDVSRAQRILPVDGAGDHLVHGAAQSVGTIGALGVGGYIALAGLWSAPVRAALR